MTENTLHILDSGKLVKKVSIDRGSAVAIADQVVVGSKSGELSVYSTTGEKQFDLPPLRAAATKLALSENGNLLAAGESTGKIILYDLSTKSVVTSRWTFHTAQINDIDWLGNEYIASVSLDTNIYIYSVKTPMKNLKSLNAHKEEPPQCDGWQTTKSSLVVLMLFSSGGLLSLAKGHNTVQVQVDEIHESMQHTIIIYACLED